ncbi:MAG TPA: GIY-YIG nuclease family protein [bacterium (Candidatus Stahlbacteria)]|nr:GIY-YIG nuclease family protein [Candidatus Stahlbacteria bacterium]
MEKDQPITVGRLGKIFFHRGLYFYVGSAKRGIEARVRRHLTSEKRHWHIDYLLTAAELLAVLTVESGIECDIAIALSQALEPISRFGSSDCRCKSHLYYLEV